MYEVLDAVNRGQSQLPPSHFRPAFSVSYVSHAAGTRGDGPSSSRRIKRDSEGEGVEPNNTSSSSSQTGSLSHAPRHSAPNGDHDRDGRDRDERGGGRERERRDGERGREPVGGFGGDRKRSLGYNDGREREDRGSYDRDHRECKQSVHLYPSFVLDPIISLLLVFFISLPVISPPLEYRSHRTLNAPLSPSTGRHLHSFSNKKKGKTSLRPHTHVFFP